MLRQTSSRFQIVTVLRAFAVILLPTTSWAQNSTVDNLFVSQTIWSERVSSPSWSPSSVNVLSSGLTESIVNSFTDYHPASSAFLSTVSLPTATSEIIEPSVSPSPPATISVSTVDLSTELSMVPQSSYEATASTTWSFAYSSPSALIPLATISDSPMTLAPSTKMTSFSLKSTEVLSTWMDTTTKVETLTTADSTIFTSLPESVSTSTRLSVSSLPFSQLSPSSHQVSSETSTQTLPSIVSNSASSPNGSIFSWEQISSETSSFKLELASIDLTSITQRSSDALSSVIGYFTPTAATTESSLVADATAGWTPTSSFEAVASSINNFTPSEDSGVLESMKQKERITELEDNVKSLTIALAVIASILGLVLLLLIIYVFVKNCRTKTSADNPDDYLENLKRKNPPTYFRPQTTYEMTDSREKMYNPANNIYNPPNIYRSSTYQRKSSEVNPPDDTELDILQNNGHSEGITHFHNIALDD
ncbi:topoisomerase I damage affected protein 7 [Biomphalaria pfeifferi]|uniref:Topoisomerase I damage affected protein 7 n=1 Tax=Biomphalaria pfeifferi TaxID=112525 RepID=A0AAD8AXP9_BIOPF|nr:topoisomerase I damage affected protein 7 [Biomphalaria pfeifferi]